MIKALKYEEILDENGKIDTYAFMRSQEIREYLIKTMSFSVIDKINIILKSMNPFEIKIHALDLLSTDGSITRNERLQLQQVSDYLARVLQEIAHPSKNAIFALRECHTCEEETLNSFEASVKDQNTTSYYWNWQEIVKEYEMCQTDNPYELPYRLEVDLVYTDPGCKGINPISFSATLFDGKIGIYNIFAASEWGKRQGYDEEITSYLNYEFMSRYPLPFPDKSRIQIKTPFMRKPLYGIIDSSMDDFGCWYHFFYPDKDKRNGQCIDLSCLELFFGTSLSVFDWVFSAYRE